jgi:hypothetical protein
MKLEIGKEGYKISLLRVVPGKEVSVAKKLKKAISDHTPSNPVVLLKVFGRYDLCAIYKTNDYLSGPSKGGSINCIREGNQIFAFPWTHGSTKPPKKFEPNNEKVWGLLFFRINEKLGRNFGLLIENMLTRNWEKVFNKKEDVKIDIFGTTGWAELVLIARGQTFKSVTETISEVSKLKVVIKSNEGSNEHLFSAKTFSFFGINFELVMNKSRSKLKENLSEEIRYGEGVFPVVSVTCPPGDMSKIASYGKEKIGKSFVTFGGKDLLFLPTNCMTWGELISSVLSMRNLPSVNIYSTSIEVMCADSNLADSPSDQFHGEGITVEKNLLSKFRKWGPVFENRLLNLYFGLSNLMQDPLIGDSFKDLKIVANDILPQLLALLNPSDENDREYIWYIAEALAYGAEERANGAFLAIEHVESHFSPTRGGVQRILKAISVLAKCVLKKAGANWNGFPIAGFWNQGYSSHGEIINLPLDYLLMPEEWWGLFHEIGHVAFSDKQNFFDLFGNYEIAEVLDKLVPSKQDIDRLTYWKNIILEISADSFDLFFCHEFDFMAYLSNIWAYLIKVEYPLHQSHFARYFVMYQYWKYLYLKKEDHFPLDLKAEQDLLEFKKILGRLRLKKPISPLYDQEALRIFRSIRPIIQILHNHYKTKSKQNIDSSFSQETKAVFSKIKKGKIYLEGPITDPAELILLMKKNKKEMTHSARMAAIFSLWHTGTMDN